MNEATTAPVPELLSLALVRRYFVPLGARTIFRLISSGQFPAADVRIGRKVRLWKRETVEAWIDDRAEGHR